MRTTVARPELLTADEAISWLSAWLDAPAYDDANDMMRGTPFERADEIDVPVTIAWGEEDRLVAPPRAERMPRGHALLHRPGLGPHADSRRPGGCGASAAGSERGGSAEAAAVTSVREP